MEFTSVGGTIESENMLEDVCRFHESKLIVLEDLEGEFSLKTQATSHGIRIEHEWMIGFTVKGV